MQDHPGFITADVGGLARGTYDLLLVSTDSQGRVVKHDFYTMNLGTTDASTYLTRLSASAAQSYSGTGWRVDQTGLYVRLANSIDVFDLRSSSDAARAFRIRVSYTNTSGSAASVNHYAWAENGSFSWSLLGANLSAPIHIEMFDSAENSLGEVTGGVAGQALSFQYAHTKSSAVVLRGWPTSTETVTASYTSPTGATGTIALKRTGDGAFYFDYLEAGLAPGIYQIKLEAADNLGRQVFRSQASLNLGASTFQVTFTGEAIPPSLVFDLQNDQYDPATMGQITHIEMRYRLKDSQDVFFAETITTDIQYPTFKWPPTQAALDQEYEYYYDVYVSGGTTSSEPYVLARNSGYFKLHDPGNTSNSQAQWMWSGYSTEGATVHRRQSYNAFGEVISETDGRGNVTDLKYNALGMLTSKKLPTVSYTLANGAKVVGRPETTFYYDLLGQLTGVKDANGKVNKQAWRVRPDGKSFVVQEWHADGGTKKFGFDVLGNMRYTVDEENRRTDYTYDAMGRLLQVQRPVDPNNGNVRSTESYEYDQAGNRIASTDALGHRSKTYYDILGRVTKFVSAQGRTTTYAYSFNAATLGLDGVRGGGWVRTTTNAEGLASTDTMDAFDRVVTHTDFGGHVFTYTYNKAGLIASQTGTSGQSISYQYFANGLLHSITDAGTNTQSSFQYDDDGNRTREIYAVQNGTPLQSSVVQYDALNRVTAIEGGDYTISYEYDQVGNRRRVYSRYTDGLGNTQAEQDYWYRYDEMNRFVVAMGQLAGSRGGSATTIVAGTTGDGVALTYFKDGQRKSATYASTGQTPGYTETYAYDANGGLTTVTMDGVVRAERVNDAAGRVTHYIERNADNTVRTDVTRTWDADNLQTTETDSTTGRLTTYSYLGDGTLSRLVSEGGNSAKTTTTYSYEWWDNAKQTEIKLQAEGSTPGWAAGFSRFTYDVNGHAKTATDVEGKRQFRYVVDGDGQVLRRNEYLGASTNSAGELVGAVANRSHSYYYLSGHRVGNVGNDGVEPVNYAQELARTTPEQTKAEDYYKRFKPTATADFDENYLPVNRGYPGAAPGSYTVRGGDSLRSIATQLWGDGSMWYVLADANGLSGNETLVAGTVLRVPNKVTNIHNTSETYKPYDPGLALGDTSPTLPAAPPPPGRGGCGGFGQVLAIVVAVVATIYTAGLASSVLASGMTVSASAASAAGAVGVAGATAATAVASVAGTMAAGATALAGGSIASAVVGGAVGSVLGQAVGMATGVQDKFSWTGVALGAIGAGATAGLGQGLMSPLTNALGSQTAAHAALGGIRSVATQGVGVVTGLQSSFDWKGVAASAVAGGLAYQASNAIGELQYGEQGWASLSSGVNGHLQSAFFARDAAQTALRAAGSGLAAGVSSALVRGGSLSDSWDSIVQDVVGSTVGNAVADRLVSASAADALKHVSVRDLEVMDALGARFSQEIWEEPGTLNTLARAAWAVGPQGKMYSADTRRGIAADFLALDKKVSAADVEGAMKILAPLFGEPVQAGTAGLNPSVPSTLAGITADPFVVSLPPLPTVVVSASASSPFLGHYTVDDMAVGAGRVVQRIGEEIDRNPLAKLALKALDVAAGPVAFALREAVMMTPLGDAITRGQAAVAGYMAQGFGEAGYDFDESNLGAMGSMSVGALALGGVTGAVKSLRALGLGNTGTSAAVDAAVGGRTLSQRPDAYQGVRDASAYLKSMNVDRATRVEVLQSFDVSTMSVKTAGDNLFGLRFHDFGENAKPLGSYLFETFTPQTNRSGLALPHEWNGMTGIQQWQVKPGTTYLRGIAAPQFDFGLQYTGGAQQMYILQPWKYGSLR
ncbi:MAG: LysM peptidoglycan-binding domain-containing protein [Pigmentiphaga sp.]|uniref:LysM peptidoglycan-binding domain-containing protein n=1 Tax=Pigmentiphaga sp. TaxID=1977564 RepID=UPI0029BCE818|nr:LysM peptidoglycan-binding domain-containing protein [Pigmentiphaga sp.]MDX3905609.1 LysM peptidoglycan-binding domain-containing protein [Pigmentiphaga sp.]